MNKQNAHLYLPLIQALAEGKTIECQNTESTWVNSANPSFYRTPECYRIKPEPVMIPLRPKDVPPGSVIRLAGSDYWSLVIYANREIVKLHDRELKYGHLCPTYEIKRPGEDWMPCHKPA